MCWRKSKYFFSPPHAAKSLHCLYVAMKQAVWAVMCAAVGSAALPPCPTRSEMPMKCIPVMAPLTGQQLQALRGNSLQKPVTVKCFFVSEETDWEGAGVRQSGGDGGGVALLCEPD